MPPKDIFVVTHTQSVHHVDRLVGGWYDTELTAKGRADAIAAADRLWSLTADREPEIFSSDLLRASQTADAVRDRFGGSVVLMPELREKSYGEAGGRPQAWLRERETAQPHDNRLDHRGGIEGAETLRELATRVYSAMDTIVERPSPTQIIVTHGFALTFVVAAWIKMPIESVGYVNFRVRSGSITHLRTDEFWGSRMVYRLGDASHLQTDS